MGYNLFLKRDTINKAIHRTAAIAEAKFPVTNIAGYVEKFTPNHDNQQLVADQMLSKLPTELYYEERTVFRKRINNTGT